MILDEVTLTNFGLYAGRQRVPLTPPTPDQPIVLFGGLNGGGKTTLLEALQLCLFGPHARTASRGRLSYSDYLSRCIHDKAQDPLASVQIAFRHTVDGAEETYSIRRQWRRATGRCREEFDVLKNGRLAPVLAENWASHVEELLPANISHLFLFDGEQIERYASPTHSASLIGTAIENLLGLDVVDRLDKDVRVFERRKKAETLNDEARAKVTVAEGELAHHRRQVETLKQEKAALRNRIDRVRRQLEAVDQDFQRLGGSLYERREHIESELTETQAALADSADVLRELAGGPLPLVLVRALLTSAADRDREERETGVAGQLHGLLLKRDAAVDDYLARRGADVETRNLLRDYFREDRAAHDRRARRGTVLNLPEAGRGVLAALLHGQLEDVAKVADERLVLHERAVARVAQAQSVQQSIPDADAVVDVLERRDAIRAELQELETQWTSMTEGLTRLEREADRRERSLAGLMEAAVKDGERREDRDRVLRSATKVHRTLTAFRRAVVARHVSRIEHLVLESYQHLLRKTSLVTRLEIDPIEYSLKLFGKSGEVVRAESLSAGERQLLGIALLWGMAKASGRPLPTAIDTPLGRLDTGHRRHFVERYLPYASHQTLVFSTDEEIVGDYLARLGPWIGRSYHLKYSDTHGRTVVEPGYFDGECVNGH